MLHKDLKFFICHQPKMVLKWESEQCIILCTKSNMKVSLFNSRFSNGSAQITQPVLHPYVVDAQSCISGERQEKSPHWLLQNLVCKRKVPWENGSMCFDPVRNQCLYVTSLHSTKGSGILSLITSESLLRSWGEGEGVAENDEIKLWLFCLNTHTHVPTKVGNNN